MSQWGSLANVNSLLVVVVLTLEVAFRLISNNHSIGSMLRVVLSSAYQHIGSKIQHQNSPSVKRKKSPIVAPFPGSLLPFFFEERTWEWMVNFDVESPL